MVELIETEVVPKNEVLCNHCNQIITVCDYCKDYFMVGDIIFCTKVGKHYCSECVDEHKEEIQNG
jgi:hypothetical protein